MILSVSLYQMCPLEGSLEFLEVAPSVYRANNDGPTAKKDYLF